MSSSSSSITTTPGDPVATLRDFLLSYQEERRITLSIRNEIVTTIAPLAESLIRILDAQRKQADLDTESLARIDKILAALAAA